MMQRKLALFLGSLAMAGIGFVGQANAAYIQDFETNADGWGGGDGITLISQSNGSDGQYAKIDVKEDAYSSGYGIAGVSYFGGTSTIYTGSFTQSIDIYVDTSWALAPKHSYKGFWLDMSPASTDGSYVWDVEESFGFRPDTAGNGPITVVDNHQTSNKWTISDTGWYTFAITFDKDNSNNIVSTMEISHQDGASLGSFTKHTNLSGNFGDLGSGGYVEPFVWANGFANNVLYIDNIKSDAKIVTSVPTPSGLFTLASFGFLALLSLGLRSRTSIPHQ